MVTITDFKTIEKENGESFNILIVTGGLQAEKSKSTGKTYFTAKTASVSSTFDEAMCKSLVGQQIEGSVKKVTVEPYEYAIAGTDEVITLSHRYEYVDENDTIINEQVASREVVY
ncbi:hypothetical protein AAU57_03510 [Nonlabens sp. YIK11]|uniref:hypothetical protein n=1 Tax=Nonlabens sp. YIK11 TaxID=1453349 RepID=UPI0006DCB220|nr:hypothetical protein [Nonlabens sp. YIK11]KQC32504.1 hypothetical protein AAU57_03510 [Nonlabens sp. YIK11]